MECTYGIRLTERICIRKLLEDGLKVNAIKLVREHTGLGLKEAKGIVDGWQETGVPC